MSEVLGLAFVGTVLGCISAIVTAVGVYYLGYILYFYLGHRLADRIFDSSLVYIKNNGCGLDVNIN